jgi:hypothetical protein
MPGEEPSLSELITTGTENALNRIWTALPAIVESYDPVTNLAVVKFAVMNSLWSQSGKRTYEETSLATVPVIFPRAGGDGASRSHCRGRLCPHRLVEDCFRGMAGDG